MQPRVKHRPVKNGIQPRAWHASPVEAKDSGLAADPRTLKHPLLRCIELPSLQMLCYEEKRIRGYGGPQYVGHCITLAQQYSAFSVAL